MSCPAGYSEIPMPRHISSGNVPSASMLETLFRYEFAILKLRDEINDFHERMLYDRENSSIRYTRIKYLGLLALLLENKDYIKLLIDFCQAVDHEHFDCQRRSGVSKDDLGLVSFQKSCNVFSGNVSAFLLTFGGKEFESLKKKLDFIYFINKQLIF